MRFLDSAPVPLTRQERIATWVLSVLVALSRWPAVSATLWDWDEALFALALRHYDVTLHHPHPPGFPLFIAMAKLLPFDGFHSLQCVTVTASLFVFPAMFFFARELRVTSFAAIASALLLAFFPNVWFYGGTALSDVPSLVLVLLACTLLLRGCRSNGSLLAGCVMLGIAAGVRPQNLLIGFAPFVIAFLHRRRTAFAGGLITAAIVAASFGSAAMLSGGWDAYRAALAKHEQYIRQTDSFLSPIRPWLPQVVDDFFIRPYRAPIVNVLITFLAAIGFVRRRNWIALATFGPFLFFAWLYLDFHSASRFSIGYMPLYALFAAQGIPSRARVPLLAAVTAILVIWSWPALRIVHETMSPPVAAIDFVRTFDPRTTVVYVDPRLAAHAELLLPQYRRVITDAVRPPAGGKGVLLREGVSVAPGARMFRRERERLEGIARPRYFEVYVNGQGPPAAGTRGP
ncbi:MAG: glycosyltransferase family 39 protein, partial [Acidobacteriota bacterium]|nr:glycosyltransferase family 39 protein [Acidobacteriota bacterium]